MPTHQSKALLGEEQQQDTSIMCLALDHQHFQSTRAPHANLCQHRHQIKRLTYMNPCDLPFIANRIQAHPHTQHSDYDRKSAPRIPTLLILILIIISHATTRPSPNEDGIQTLLHIDECESETGIGHLYGLTSSAPATCLFSLSLDPKSHLLLQFEKMTFANASIEQVTESTTCIPSSNVCSSLKFCCKSTQVPCYEREMRIGYPYLGTT